MDLSRGALRLCGLATVAAAIALSISGCATAETPGPLVLPEARAKVYLLGDSWSTGYSADVGKGYPDLLASETGWELSINAQSGTGYTANLAGTGSVFGERVGELPDALPELVLVQGGLNDEWGSPGHVGDEAASVVEALHQRYPGVPVVLVGPSTAKWPVTKTLWSIDAQLDQVADEKSAWYVSPLADQWFTGENISTTIDPETKHPSTDGHRVFAEHLLASLRALR